jgi:hypothetical protein
MHAFARFLQLAGLTIPPLAMIAQLSNAISAGKMLQFVFQSLLAQGISCRATAPPGVCDSRTPRGLMLGTGARPKLQPHGRTSTARRPTHKSL